MIRRGEVGASGLEKEGDKRRQSHAVIWGNNTIPSPLGCWIRVDYAF